MGTISKVRYQGALRNDLEHLASGQIMQTDAPLDNNGLGQAFSPTDLLATSLASCALTVMGIRARQEGFDLEDCEATVDKLMASEPRRVAAVQVRIRLKANCSEKMQRILEGVGRNCPVAKSLDPQLEQSFVFEWLD